MNRQQCSGSKGAGVQVRCRKHQTEAVWLLLPAFGCCSRLPEGSSLVTQNTNQKELSPHGNFGIQLLTHSIRVIYCLLDCAPSQLSSSGAANSSAVFRFTDSSDIDSSANAGLCTSRLVLHWFQDVCGIFGKASHHPLPIKPRIDFKLMLMLPEQFPSGKGGSSPLLSSSPLLPSPLLIQLLKRSFTVTGSPCVIDTCVHSVCLPSI